MAANEYEIERLRVIAENQKLLQSLGLDHFASSSSSLAGGSSRASPSTSRGGSKRKAAGGGVGDEDDDGEYGNAVKEAAKRRKARAARTKAEREAQVEERAKSGEAGGKRESTRKSSRLQKLDVDDEVAVKAHAEEQERLALLRIEAEKRDRKVRFQTMTLEEMCDDPPKTSVRGKMVGLIPRLVKVASNPHPRVIPPIDPYADTLPNSPTSTSADSSLREAFSRTRLVATARVTPERVYSMVVHPDPKKTLVFVGDKRGTLGFWDALDEGDEVEEDVSGKKKKGGKVGGVKKEEDGDDVEDGVKEEDGGVKVEVKAEEEDDDDEEEEEDVKPQGTVDGLGVGKIWRIQAHAKNSISSIKLDPVDATKLFTASYDNTLRSLSLLDGKSIEILSVPDENCLLTNFDFTPSGQEMWVTDSQGGLTHLDMREGGKEGWGRRRWVTGLLRSTMKIGGVAVNPVSPWILMTASNDRTMKLWDTRQMTKIKCEPIMDLLTSESANERSTSGQEYYNTSPTEQCEFEEFTVAAASKARAGLVRGKAQHGQSCSSAYWDLWGKRALTTSYDDKLRVFDFESSSLTASQSQNTVTELKPRHAIKHDCQCGRWVSILKAVWSPNTEYGPHFSVGNMKKRINIYSGLTGAMIAEFGSGHVTAVPAVTASHPSIVNTVVGGNNSGKVQLWAEPVE